MATMAELIAANEASMKAARKKITELKARQRRALRQEAQAELARFARAFMAELGANTADDIRTVSAKLLEPATIGVLRANYGMGTDHDDASSREAAVVAGDPVDEQSSDGSSVGRSWA